MGHCADKIGPFPFALGNDDPLTRRREKFLRGKNAEGIAIRFCNAHTLALAALAKVHSALETEIVPFHTRGDLILDKPLWAISNQGKGVFASEFEEMLLRDEIDIAIHSGKDLPVLLADGLEIIGVLKRDDPRDVLVMPKGKKAEVCKIIGTGSPSVWRKAGFFLCRLSAFSLLPLLSYDFLDFCLGYVSVFL